MLIWRTADTTPDNLRAVARNAEGETECLVRDDGLETLITCDHGRKPEGVEEVATRRVHNVGINGPDGGNWLFVVGIWTPAECGRELCAWYEEEHAPMLMQCADWKGVDLHESPCKSGRQFHVLHRLADRTALDSPHRAASRRTPWFNQLSTHTWFDAAFQRSLYRRTLLVQATSN